jgi:integrase
MMHRTLIPEFGSKRLSELKRTDVRLWHAKQTHRPRQANLDLAILRKALSLAVADELIGDNPAKGITPHPEKARDRVPTDDELRAVWSAIDEAPIRDSARTLFKLLALTGCRREEWRSARWCDVDLQGAVYRLQDGKAGGRNVPLSGPVLALLRAVEGRSEWIVPHDSGTGPMSFSNIRDAWASVLANAGVTGLRLHDLRHAFATRGASLGANALVLRDALGHKTLAMTSRYVARQTDPVRDLAERVGQTIIAAAAVVSGRGARSCG